MEPVSERLRRYLAEIPRNQNYVFNERTRRLLRRALYTSATNNGEYLKELFKDQRYFLDDNETSELSWIVHDQKSTDPSHVKGPCSRKFRIGEPIYRCLTCGLDDTCALCSDCFDENAHKGHQLYINICQRENGGVCDCGDPEAWNVDLNCQYFQSNIVESEVPQGLYDALLTTFDIVLDYIIDVMANSNLMYSEIPQTPEAIRAYSDNSSLQESKYGAQDINSSEYGLILYNDQVRQQQDAIRRIHLATGKVKEYATMITREVEAYGKALVLGSNDLELLIERQKIMRSTGFNTAIRSSRDIFREDSCDEIIKWIEDITSSSIFQKYTGFRDLVCKSFVKKWSPGINKQVFTNHERHIDALDENNLIPLVSETPNTSDKSHPTYWDFEYTKWSLPEEICREIDYNDDEMIRGKNAGSSFLGSRLQYLLFMDIRFWKSIRLVLHDLYIYVLISNLTFKQVINCQYADIYPQVAEMFLSIDREAESSLMCSLSTQLFTCPSNATTIMKHGSISRFLAIFYSFITKNAVEGPNSIDISNEINFANLKNRKWCQLFFDMGYIISRNELVDLIYDERVLNQVVDVLFLFQGCPTLKRSPKEHVEYESSDYTIYFHAISILSHFVEGIARCINKFLDTSENKKLVENAINLVITRIGENIKNANFAPMLGKVKKLNTDVDVEPVNYIYPKNEDFRIIEFVVSKRSVSFIHCLHSFLSWLIELNKFYKDNSLLESTVMNYYAKEPVLGSKTTFALQLFDYPLRTLVLLSQIKVGFWVRNGFSVRTQMQIYRNSTIRDGGYSRDLYLAQCFVATMPEDVTASTIFQRWELMPWIENRIPDSHYGKDTIPLMVEECLLFFINILTDDSHLKQLTGDKVSESRVIKEIICALCFKPLSFSELVKEVPDHIASEKKFEYILDIVADLVPPKSHNDVGLYKLKEKYFDEIDPFFVHYTSNKRDEAIGVLKARIHKKTGKPLDEICLEPNIISLNEDHSVYHKLPRFTNTTYFIEFLESTLSYVDQKGLEKNDTLLDLTLYLVHVCCIYNYQGKFVPHFLDSFEGNVSNPSIGSLLYGLLFKDDYKSYHIKIRVIFELVIQKCTPELFSEVMSRRVKDFDMGVLSASLPGSSLDAESELEKKKRKANKRKMKILERFKKQQDQFLANNEGASTVEEPSDAEMFDDEFVEDKGSYWSYPEEHCILCQMHKEGEAFGTVCCISSSPEFRHVPFDDSYWFMKAFSDNENLDHENLDFQYDDRYSEKWHSFMSQRRRELVVGPLFPHSDGLIEDHQVITSCSHGMHYSCFVQYFKDTRKRATQITRKLPEDFAKQEFLCPLCKSLNNCFIPIMSQSNRAPLVQFVEPVDESNDNSWYTELQDITKVDFQVLKENYVADAILSSKDNLIHNYYQALFVNPDRERKMHSSIMHSLASSLGLIGNLGDIFEKPNIESILLHTIESAEISLRGVPHKNYLNGIVISQLSNQTLTTLRVFSNFRDIVEVMNLFTCSKRDKKGVESENSKFINPVEQTLGKLLLLGTPDELADVLLTIDFFELFIEVEGTRHLDIKTHSVLRACYTAQVLQNLYLLIFNLTSNYEQLSDLISEVPSVPTNVDLGSMKTICRDIFRHIHLSSRVYNEVMEEALENDEFIEKVFSMLLKTTTPFLRKCAIFSFIKCANCNEIDFEKYDYEVLECDRLCEFLNVPSLVELGNKFLATNTAENAIYDKLVTKEPPLSLPLVSYHIKYPGVVGLSELPERLDDFFTKLYYPNNLSSIKNPAICLHCCAILDMQNLPLGSAKGECYQHYKNHCFNDDNGIFLLPKNTRFLILHEDNGSFHDAPYIDPHFELDKEGTHGHVMKLSKERYSSFIRSVWLGHDVANYITRALENNVDVGGWETL